ncbi:hypothetical protein MHYP_G00294480 [Metynnis hypsauchen]
MKRLCGQCNSDSDEAEVQLEAVGPQGVCGLIWLHASALSSPSPPAPTLRPAAALLIPSNLRTAGHLGRWRSDLLPLTINGGERERAASFRTTINSCLQWESSTAVSGTKTRSEHRYGVQREGQTLGLWAGVRPCQMKLSGRGRDAQIQVFLSGFISPRVCAAVLLHTGPIALVTAREEDEQKTRKSQRPVTWPSLRVPSLQTPPFLLRLRAVLSDSSAAEELCHDPE